MLENILQVNAGNARPVDFDPLFGKAGFVNVADVQMNPYPRAVHFIQELPELARRNKKPVLGIAVFTTYLHARLGRFLVKRP